jgi:hypothetical protein
MCTFAVINSKPVKEAVVLTIFKEVVALLDRDK